MNKTKLRQFLIDSNRAGYASGKEKKWLKETNGSTTIPFKQGDWRSDDNFFGGEPYGGRTVIFYKNKPVWIMVYYGWIAAGVEVKPIYTVLRNALKQMPEICPLRGPKKYKQGKFNYLNSWQGDVDQFFGKEQILRGDKLVYKANYLGGFVGQKRGV